jgi:hypothetical protein
MRTILAAAIAVVALAAAGAAQAAERLVLAPYPASPPWKEVTNRVSGLQFLREQIPANQTIAAYRDILTAQSFPQQAGVDPAAYLRNVAQGVTGACRGVRISGPTPRREAGYAVAYAQFYCGRQNGESFGVVMFFKAIAGTDALYVVQREFRVPPSATPGVMSGSPAATLALLNAQQTADKYLLEQVYLCGPQGTDPRCRGR